MEYPGLLNWANSIRLTMANDSGRQLFKDQIQTHGFSFLDDYLDNITSGGKQDSPLIELVKTPGRKKAIARKPKLMSKLSVVSLSLDINDMDKSSKDASRAGKRSGSDETQQEKHETTTSVDVEPPSEVIQPGKTAPSTHEGLNDPQLDHNDLSVIAEDDETGDRSQILPQKTEGNPFSQAISFTVSQTTKETEKAEKSLLAAAMDVDKPGHSQQPVPAVTQPSEDTAQEPCSPKASQTIDNELNTYEETQLLVMDDAQEDTMQVDSKTSEKTSTYFPFLPDPAPLRKSIKIGAATPGAAVGGKRTSWLKKGRDLKALEMTTQKPVSASTTFAAPQLPPNQGTKRKSNDAYPSTQSISATDDEHRHSKVAKTSKGGSPSGIQDDTKRVSQDPDTRTPDDDQMDVEEEVPRAMPEAVLDRLKKTVEDLGTRSSKSTMAKSLGGDAANALAEARAAAEARVAERDRIEEEHTMALQRPFSVLDSADLQPKVSGKTNQALDLFPTEGRMKDKGKAPERPFQFTPKDPVLLADKEDPKRSSTSTTPPNSPPQPKPVPFQPLTQPLVSVFKPTPVFVPPVPVPLPAVEPAASAFSERLVSKPSPIFSAPSNPFAAALNSFAEKYTAPPLASQSTLESVQSDRIFDDDTVPTWLPTTQDTEYTQSQPQTQICDEDDSWPVDEKLAAGVQWTFGGKEDSLTWSTLPSQSQRGDTGTSSLKVKPAGIPGAYDAAMEEEGLMSRDHELEEIVLGSSKATFNSEPLRSQSQMSFASSESSQSQVGFFGQATKLLSNALGTKKKPEVKKVLQKAAEAAKKQQEEADKKAARLKEMESRRQLALQRKAEEEKAKVVEEERKMKEEVERRKREREDLTDKRALKTTSSKKEEELKTRKVEAERKPELKKPSSSAFLGKLPVKSAMKQPTTSMYGQAQKEPLKATGDGATSSLKSKMNASSSKSHYDDDIAHPSQALQMQMAARAKAHLEAAKPQVPSESIELPDVNSEYSDSDDEDRKRTFDPPDWAQSPELRTALEQQSTINPDDIFGAVRPLKMEEMFKNRTGRFRARTSSANWTGADRLTAQEEAEYARRMGFK
ncbi:hypothetical protein CVT24_004325 [Panaeolus cyanescens]|uniref:Inner centromere protein ARK-binding domain-containing protein n=1 Tax=Panaeolus cyanescens TaxID=181874 RepID=A0A409VA98_9AGAR|nr:hypothetical protein CVT24_004325 [Panaeolus cyanescens]